MTNIYKRWLCEEGLKTPLLATHFNIFWILKQAFTHYCHLHGPLLAQQIICDKNCFLMLFLYFRFSFSYFTLLLIFKKFIILSLYHYNFLMNIIFIFSCSAMFRDVPECSGMFRVPGFIDAQTEQPPPIIINSHLNFRYLTASTNL